MRKFSKLIVLFLSLALFLGLTACVKEGPVDEEKIELSFEKASVSLQVGQEDTLATTISKDGLTLVWSSSDATIVTVDQTGKIAAVKEGTATVKASVKDTDPEVYAEVTVTVTPVPIVPPTSVLVTGNPAIAKVGQTTQLSVSVVPNTAPQGVTYSSNNEAVATVSDTGLVSYLGLGTVKITVTSVQDTTKSKVVTINVVEPDPATITVTGQDGATSVEVYATLQLGAVVAPDLADDEVTWSSSDNSIATVDTNGLVTGVAMGTVTITATSTAKTDVSGSLELTVIKPSPSSITVVSDWTIIQVEEELQLTTAVDPAAAEQGVTFSSSDTSIATVDETGKVVGVAAGEVVITVTSSTLDTVKAAYNLKVVAKVENPNYTNIYVDPAITAERFSTLTIDGVDYIVGVNALKDVADAFSKAVEGSTIVVAAGVYADEVAINVNNVTVKGPNAGIDPVANLTDRVAEAEFQNTITLGNVTNVVIDGIKLTSRGQIYSVSAVKDLTIKNVYSIDSSEDPAQGVIFLGINDDALVNENVVILNCSINDTTTSGYRGIRINNAKDVTVKYSYFYGFYDAIRFEGTGNSGWSQPGTGSGLAGNVVIEHNKFEHNNQYPIVAGRWSATSVEINDNNIGVTEGSLGVYGLIYLNNYVAGDYSTVVNVQRNEFPFAACGFHDLRFKTADGTADKVQINVNYNIFYQDAYNDPTDGQYMHIINHSYDATNPNTVLINAENNAFLVTPKPEFFSGADYEPYYTNLQDIYDVIYTLYVDDDWASNNVGDKVNVDGTEYTFGERAFATVADALAVVHEGAKIVVLPGTYTDNATISKSVTLVTPNANVNPTTDDSAFLAASTTATTVSGVWYVNANDVTISGFSFTGAARVRGYGNTGERSGFVFENNYVYDTNASDLAWKAGYYSAYGVTDADDATTPGFLNVIPSKAWLTDFQIVNNKFNNLGDTAVYLTTVNGGTITGNVFNTLSRDAIRFESSYSGGVFNIKDNSFENVAYNGIYFRNYGSSAAANDFVANIENNTFKNVGSTEAASGTKIGAISSAYFSEGKSATFNIKFNVFDNCVNYISLRNNVTSSATWATSGKTWTANVEYNAFIETDTVAYYFQDLLGSGDDASTNVNTVVINNNFYGTDAATAATVTPAQFDLHDTTASNTNVFTSQADLNTAIAALNN